MTAKIVIMKQIGQKINLWPVDSLLDVYDATQAGDLVVVYPGTYDIGANSIQLKDGVNWQFIGRPTILSSAVTGTFMDDNVAITVYYLGEVDIQNTIGEEYKIVKANAGSVIHVPADEVLNRASAVQTGANALSIGNSNIASGSYSFAEGYFTTASGSYSHSEGRLTVASGGYSHAEGRQTTASSSYAHAEGSSTTASGIASHAEGQGCIASGEGSHAEGRYSKASRFGQHTHASNKWALDGEAQYSRLIMMQDTIDAAEELLYTGAERVILDSSRTYCFRGKIVARRVGGSSGIGSVGDSKAFSFEGVISRDDSDNTSMVGTPNVNVLAYTDSDVGADNATGWTISISANDADETLDIKVEGLSNTSIHWVCLLEWVEVG